MLRYAKEETTPVIKLYEEPKNSSHLAQYRSTTHNKAKQLQLSQNPPPPSALSSHPVPITIPLRTRPFPLPSKPERILAAPGINRKGQQLLSWGPYANPFESEQN